MGPARYAMQQKGRDRFKEPGWCIWDNERGSIAVVDGEPMVGLTEEEAELIYDRLLTEHGDAERSKWSR